jgi:pilus assembly protein CpaF
MNTVTVEELIEVIQEALVEADARDGATMDDLEREAFAHDIATRHLAVRARRAVEHGELPIDIVTETELITKAIAGYFGSGKFQVLLDLPDATDIMVNGPDAIWVQYSDGRAARHPSRLFADDDDLRAEVARLARRAGGTERRFDDGKPLLVLRLPDGSRMAATMVVSSHVNVAIRRNVLPAASLQQLAELGTIDEGMRSLLAAAMRARMRIVVSGETGAGKSTLTRALIHELPPTTRMVVIEDTRELNISDDPERALAVLEWETREANVEGVGEITQSDLVRQALRFNPEWLIVGEVRDAGAAREMLMAMQHGHPSLSTVHHHSAATAWRKLAQYITQGTDAMAFEIAALVISDAVDFFVHLARDRRGRRVVAEVCETAGWNGTEVQLNRIYVPDPSGRGRPQVHLSDARRRRLLDHGFDDGLLMNPDGWWRS